MTPLAPAGLRAPVIARLRSGDSRLHFASLMELAVHATLTSHGIDVCPLPEAGNPDFVVRSKGEPSAYIEVATVRDCSTNVRHLFFQRVSALVLKRDPSLRIAVRRVLTTSQTPRAKPFVEFLLSRRCVYEPWPADANMDRPEWPGEIEYFDAKSGWCITYRYAHRAVCRDDAESIVSFETFTVAFPDDAARIERMIREKLKQHSSLDLPLLVAIGWHEFGPSSRVLRCALESIRRNHRPTRFGGLLWGKGVTVWSAESADLALWTWGDTSSSPWQYWPLTQNRLCLEAPNGDIE